MALVARETLRLLRTATSETVGVTGWNLEEITYWSISELE